MKYERTKALKILTLLIVSAASLFAQGTKDTLSFLRGNYSTPLVSSYFNKELSTYNSIEYLRYSFSAGKFFLGVNERYNTTVVKSYVNHVKDEQNFNALGEYGFSKLFSGGFFVSDNIYSDDRKISINKASVNYLALFSKFNFRNYLKVIPFAGYSLNQQIGEKDDGYIYGSEILTRRLKYANFSASSSMKFQNEDILPRRNLLRKVFFDLKSQFNKLAQNYLTVKYVKQRKDFYFETDSLTRNYFDVNHNIQSRTETNYIVSDAINFREPNTNLNFKFNTNVSWRDIERSTRYILLSNVSASSFDTDIREQKINFRGEVNYRSPRFNGFARMSYFDRTELHFPKNIEGANPIFFETREKLEKEKNNRSKQITLTLSANWLPDASNSFSFNLLQRKLSYDTPSKFNFDDRDELLTIFQLTYARNLSPLLNLRFALEGNVYHVVYIFAERSANNNIQRTLKFSAGCDYHSERVKARASAEVSSNYTVYDFEEENPALKSFVFRQFTVRDSSTIAISQTVNFEALGYLKLSEQGDFKWKGFKSKPSRFLSEIYATPQFVYYYKYFRFSSGIRYYSLKTYSFLSNFLKKKIKSYESVAPLSKIEIIAPGNLKFVLSGWYEFITYEDNSKKQLANLKIEMQWNF